MVPRRDEEINSIPNYSILEHLYGKSELKMLDQNTSLVSTLLSAIDIFSRTRRTGESSCDGAMAGVQFLNQNTEPEEFRLLLYNNILTLDSKKLPSCVNTIPLRGIPINEYTNTSIRPVPEVGCRFP